MPRLHKQLADNVASGEGGTFERFIASAIATLVTILLSWRILVDLVGSDDGQGDSGGGEQCLAVITEQVASSEIGERGKDRKPSKEQPALNVVVDMGETVSVERVPSQTATAVINCSSTGKMTGRSDRMTKVYKYLNLAIPGDNDASRAATSMDADTHSLGDTSSEDDAVTVIEKPDFTGEKHTNTAVEVAIMRDVIDVTRRPVGSVTSPQTGATGCDVTRTRDHVGRARPKHCGLPAEREMPRYAGQGQIANLPNISAMTRSKPRAAEGDDPMGRIDGGSVLGRSSATPTANKAADVSVLWPSNAANNVKPSHDSREINNAGAPTSADIIFVDADGDHAGHSGKESSSCDMQPTAIANMIIPDVFRGDVSSLRPTCAPLTTSGHSANDNERDQRYNDVDSAYGSAGCVKQTRGPLNLNAIPSPVTSGHSPASRVSTCPVAAVNCSLLGISSDTESPGQPALHTDYLAPTESYQRRHYCAPSHVDASNVGVYMDACLSSGVQSTPNRCVFVKTEFIAHGYCVRSTNVVQVGPASDNASTASNHNGLSQHCNTTVLGANRKTNNATNIGCNINTSVQSATKKCAPEVNLYNPRCSVRHVITSNDSSMNAHLPNTSVQQVCVTSTTSTPECGVSIDQLSAPNVCCPAYDTASSHDMISRPTEYQYWKRNDRKTTVVPRVKTADISQYTDISPSRAPAESDTHAKCGADIIINHKYGPIENRASHLARSDLSRGIGDTVGGVRKTDPASEVDIINAGRGGLVARASACEVRLPGDSAAGPALSCSVTDDRQLSTGAWPNSRQVDRDKHSGVVGHDYSGVDSRNHRATGCRPTLQRHDGAVANREIRGCASGIQEAAPSEILQQRYDGAGTSHNCVADCSHQRRSEHTVNRNTAMHRPIQPTLEYEHGNIDVHGCSDIVSPWCNERASPAISTGRSTCHGYSLRGEYDANIGTAKCPTTEHVFARINPDISTAAELPVSTDSVRYNKFDTPTVHNVANASITEHRNIADKPEVRRALKSQGRTDVLPMEVTSARVHDDTRTQVKSILKGTQSPGDNKLWTNGIAKKNDAYAEMNTGVSHSCSKDKRYGDNVSCETTHEERFENVPKPDCAYPGHAKTSGFKVYEIEFNEKTSGAGVYNASATDNSRHIRCDNEHQLGGEPPPNYFTSIDACKPGRSGDSPVGTDTKDEANMAYDAIDPVGYRCSPNGYRLTGARGGQKRRARSMATLACEFFADHSSRTSLIETDLDTGEERLTPLVRETDIDYARSMTELAGSSPVDDVMTRSLMTLPSDHETPAELMLSANELRIRQSLSKLSVPRWYAGASRNGGAAMLRNVNRTEAMPSPRTSLYLSTPNVSHGAGRELTKPVVINYRVKPPLRARAPVTGRAPPGEFELPSAIFRRHPSPWPRMETRQPPQSDRPSRAESAREAYLRLKHEQQVARDRNCRDGHMTPKTNACEAAERRSVGTRNFRSVCLTTPPGQVIDASLRTRSRGINEWAKRHSGGKGSCPVMGTRINVAELKHKSTKSEMDCAHRITNVNNANSTVISQETSVCQSPRSDASTVHDSNDPSRKQVEDVLDGLLCIPSTLPGNNISPSSSPRRHHPSDIAVMAGDDDDNRDVIVTCRNTECGRQASLSEARTCYKTCHSCYTYYCSRACRQAHWQRHKRRCVFSRVGSVCKHVIRTVHDDATLSAEMTRVARAGYLAVGRGSVRMSFPSQNDADSFLHRNGSPLISPTFLSLADLNSTAKSAAVDEHFFELTDLCKTYNPQVKYVIDVTITTAEVGDSEYVSASPTRRAGDSRTVSKCAKLRHHLPASPRHATRPEPDTLILTAVPGSELTENVAGSRARQICFVNMQRKLRQRGVSLRHQYPGVYDKLCAYVSENEHFAPITLFPLDRRTGRKFMCLIMPNSEPDVAWMHQPDILDEIGLSTAV